LTAALLSAVRARSAQLVAARVTDVAPSDTDLHRISCDDGAVVRAEAIVLAAGPWSGTIAGIPAADRPPVRPVKGEILRLRARAATPLPTRSIRALVNGREVYLVPRADGELVVGATVEERGFDTTVRAGAVRELLRDARAILPSIDELDLTEVTAALRPGSPDNLPAIGWTSTPGLLVATGHFRNGILLAPVTADLAGDLVLGIQRDEELRRLVSPLRLAARA
jgi:glycine oxidase